MDGGLGHIHWCGMAGPALTLKPRTLAGRVLLWHVLAILGLLLVLGVVVDRSLEDSLVQQLTQSLATDARAAQQALLPGSPAQADVQRLGKAMGVRITIIRTDGVVLTDSEHDPATMENHLTRPEIQQALRGSVGVSSRDSTTIGIPFRYVALPPTDNRIVRVALPLTEIHARLVHVRTILTVGFGLAALLGLATLALIARGLSRPLHRIAGAVERVGQGDLETAVPEDGTRELVALARTVNRMRDEVSRRIDALDAERRTRDDILSALEEGVVLIGGSGDVLYRNPGAEPLLGPITHVRTFPQATLREALASATREGDRVTVEIVAGPRSRTVNATVLGLSDEGQRLLVLRDVTEAKVTDAVRRDFVANASHELKTPAASVQALAETIGSAAADDPTEVPRFARRLEREAERLSRIVSDLLDLSRLEGAEPPAGAVRFDRLVREEIDRLREQAAGAEVKLNVSADSPVLVAGSARDLGLMVRNLVQNAIQYTRPGGSVEVDLRMVDGSATLTVADTGLGIPARDQKRVFERFYRVDRARSRETGGTGLGLSIVKHVAENHGGRVALESALGEGSRFTVLLPLAPVERTGGARSAGMNRVGPQPSSPPR
jgi:two-component system, OmpR family, phosphate regulon sensor histidine kinase PhoR